MKINFMWEYFTPDPRQYMQQRGKLIPQNVLVQVEIPDEMVIIEEDESITITPEGMVIAMSLIEDAYAEETTTPKITSNKVSLIVSDDLPKADWSEEELNDW